MLFTALALIGVIGIISQSIEPNLPADKLRLVSKVALGVSGLIHEQLGGKE